ncbi:MAG: hypothetical protein A3F33_02370 [Candidatus Woykebacteria bacterium RIFCSPHIGHO2_12_FULL_43_10]|uniref:Uncharacterized protein n=2 Tax=Candidatus Woykeibacteriota TaxID=1817899 RepID=A0A1G1WTR7_9BACT|nr:MAG: hypothetical protein A2802_00895 [Candidatus Woykebacteria bacterium RIFCSPHIGHO2_01_FULL_43_29]OGY28473.1 MAG: hypothetical protein A3J50_00420 [Candidatus Woykebacteria bacterium RIFCSPHIGHO2_02_FULL_43_16b]OGY28818.1 MAG: hypothetical protein A3F33_02370 [Candidatus Woykebacteria bacterium RIFCSPHIGHO2_12_FULL_43_10]OGY31093.1 MAG: hypothetical protein A3A61_04010 [Candidatus Woykebacteria bacterium RIFCSPLOWO2_01_FULL_43_14]
MKKILSYTIFLFAISVTSTYAQKSPFGTIGAPFGPTSTYGKPGGLGAFISNAVSAATIIAGLGFLAYLIYGAFRYLTSAGDEKMATEARKSISNAFIGLVMVVLAVAVTAVVQAILGINILNPKFIGP